MKSKIPENPTVLTKFIPAVIEGKLFLRVTNGSGEILSRRASRFVACCARNGLGTGIEQGQSGVRRQSYQEYVLCIVSLAAEVSYLNVLWYTHSHTVHCHFRHCYYHSLSRMERPAHQPLCNVMPKQVLSEDASPDSALTNDLLSVKTTS